MAAFVLSGSSGWSSHASGSARGCGKNASYEVDDGDAFLGADDGGVGRPTGACGLSEAIRF